MDTATGRNNPDDTAEFTVRISDPGGIAAALPHLLGFRPQESVVLVSLTGPRGRRVGLTARADIPEPRHSAALARSLARRVRTGGPEAVLVAVVSEAPDPVEPFPELPHRPLVGALVRALADVRLAVPESFLVRHGRWWSYECSRPCCAPGAGTPLPSGITDLELAAVATGQVLAPDRAGLAARIAPRGRLIEPASAGEPDADRWAQVLTAALDRFRPGAAGGLTDGEIDCIVGGLRTGLLRDRALVLALGRDADVAELLWTECTRRSPSPLDAVPATLLAVCAWLRGDGAMANIALDRACASDPGYGFPRLLTAALETCMPPAQLRAMLTATHAELP